MKISVKVLYFASIKEQINKESEWIDFEKETQLTQLIEQITQSYSNTQEFMQKNFLIALNADIINDPKGIELKNKDEIAFLPPVTGG